MDEENGVVTSEARIKNKLSDSIIRQLGDQNARFNKPGNRKPEVDSPQPNPTQETTTEGTPAPVVPGKSEAVTTSERVEESPRTETVVEADGEVEVQYVYDESLAEGEERVEYVEVDDTTEDSAEGDASKPENGMFYLDPSNPKGTVYKTADDAKRGIRQKDEYIAKLEEQLGSTDTLKNQLDMYSSFMPPEALQSMVIESYMPEELRGIDEDEVTDANQLRLLRKARIDAELKLERELKEINNAQVEAEKAALQKQHEAESYMKALEAKNFFGIQNPEDRDRLSGMLNSNLPGSEVNASTVAILLHENFGPEVVEDYLSGIKSRFWKDTNQSVKKKVKKIITRPKTLSSSERPQPVPPKAPDAKGKLIAALSRPRR